MLEEALKAIILVIIGALFSVVVSASAANYSTEATISHHRTEGTYLVEVRVLELIEQNGKLTERIIAAPRIQSAPGFPASLDSGSKPGEPGYGTSESVHVDVAWPFPNESGDALCEVIVKKGPTIVARSRFQLKIEGPGRTPLMVSPQEVEPKSIRLVDDKKAGFFVLLEFTGKTKEAVKKLTVENAGNRVGVRDAKGNVIEGGLSFGSDTALGMAILYDNKEKATQVAGILRGE